MLYDRYFSKAACSPIVFTELLSPEQQRQRREEEEKDTSAKPRARSSPRARAACESDDCSRLYYGTARGLSTPFDPKSLLFCGDTGALYHPVTPPRGKIALNGSLTSAIAEQLVSSIAFTEPDAAGKGGYAIEWEGEMVPIEYREKVEIWPVEGDIGSTESR